MATLYQAPAWQPDRSDFLILWHGCTAFDKNAIEDPRGKGIDPAKCAVDTDFGRGFYTTTLERQAKLWAWDRFYFRQARNPGETGNQPVVLRFRVRRYSVPGSNKVWEKGLDQFSSLSFVREDFDNEDFWSLVQHCRTSIPKARGIREVIHDHKRPVTNWYEVVSGPVAAFWKQRVAMSGADQFSFHLKAIDLLNALINEGKGKGPGGQGDENFFRWYPVP